MRTLLTLLALVVASVLVGACAAPVLPASNASTAGPSTMASPPLLPVASFGASPGPSATPDSSDSHPAAPGPSESLLGSVVTTLADDGLRVRSEPRVSDDSRKLEPLLPVGSRLYVLDGPVSASGYTWYEVAPLTSRKLPSGWVASGDRDGQPWIAAADFDCPPVPADFRSLAALPPAVGLVCFRRVPITVDARLIWCACDIDGAWYTPFWFRLNDDPNLLVEPGVTSVPPTMVDWFGLNLDPDGEHPDVLPIGQIVEVTGIFDHPAASSCTRTEMDGESVPSQGCRLEFAVTRLLLYGP